MSMEPINVVFIDENPEVIIALANAFRRRFVDVVRCVLGNVFQQGPGIIVSPSNSRGDMGGGFDLQLKCRFGSDIERRLQLSIAREHGGFLPIGHALYLATADVEFPFVIFTPTVRSHMNLVERPSDVRDAARAAFRIVRELSGNGTFGGENARQILVPGMGTGVAGLEAEVAAREMYRGFAQAMTGANPA